MVVLQACYHCCLCCQSSIQSAGHVSILPGRKMERVGCEGMHGIDLRSMYTAKDYKVDTAHCHWSWGQFE